MRNRKKPLKQSHCTGEIKHLHGVLGAVRLIFTGAVDDSGVKTGACETGTAHGCADGVPLGGVGGQVEVELPLLLAALPPSITKDVEV